MGKDDEGGGGEGRAGRFIEKRARRQSKHNTRRFLRCSVSLLSFEVTRRTCGRASEERAIKEGPDTDSKNMHSIRLDRRRRRQGGQISRSCKSNYCERTIKLDRAELRSRDDGNDDDDDDDCLAVSSELYK